MAIDNTVSSDFDPRSSNVESVFDCRIPGVLTVNHLYDCTPLLVVSFYSIREFGTYRIAEQQMSNAQTLKSMCCSHTKCLYIGEGLKEDLVYMGYI